MKRVYFIYLFISLVILTSCEPTNNTENNEITTADSVASAQAEPADKSLSPSNKTVTYLWREPRYDETLDETVNALVIDEAFNKTISEPERAAIAYVATFIGNECAWDGEYKEDRSNLSCKIITALNLGYQCSNEHLGYLRQMFRNDPKVLQELASENCPTTPDGATVQDTFDEITLSVKGNELSVFFKASGINTRSGEQWSWTETNYFRFDKDRIELVKKDKSKVTYTKR